jgi:PAS domain-containing protein
MQRTWAAHPEHAAEEQILAVAIDAASDDEACLKEALDDLPVAIYLTDADGFVTFFNRACIALAGREPIVGRDRWCVTWKLYTEDGLYLPHDQCPMAIALRE